MLSVFTGQHFIMNELRLKFGKFLIILGVLSLVLFVFSIIAESSNSYFLFIGILLILFGTILRKKPKTEMTEEDLPPSSRLNRRAKKNRFDQNEKYMEDNSQIKRSRR